MTLVGLSAARRSWRAPRALAVAMAVVVLHSARSLFAQGVGATLLGTIADEQHGVLPGVSITITNVETGVARTVVTDATGYYRAPALPPGTYEVTADLTGFVTYKRSGLVLTTGQEGRIDLTLKGASVKEAGEVVAASPLVSVSNNPSGTTVKRNAL